MYITGQKAIQNRIQGRLGKFQGLYLLYRVNVIFIFCYTIYRLIDILVHQKPISPLKMHRNASQNLVTKNK